MGKRRCRECGALYEDSFQNCPVCGAHGGRKIRRCRECGARLSGGKGGRCPVCGVRQARWPHWLAMAIKAAVVVAVLAGLAASYVYSYVPQLGLPTPVWPSATTTATAFRPTSTNTATPTVWTPTRTRTPTHTRVPPTFTPTPAVTYVVKFGDTLIGIAEKFNVSVEAIMIANNLTDRELIREDQVLIIPRGTPTPLIIPTATMRPPAPVTRLPIPTSTPRP